MTATRPTTPAGSVRDYSSQSENCNIVMKGGIASGTVYPLAICELATTYRFRNVGGTSAGAIAAAAIAAAECGRREDPTGSAFKCLERLPAELGKPPKGGQDPLLFSLFQPQQRTSRAFAPLRAVLEHPDGKVEAFLKTTALGFPLWTLLGGLPGLLIAVAAGLALILVPTPGWTIAMASAARTSPRSGSPTGTPTARTPSSASWGRSSTRCRTGETAPSSRCPGTDRVVHIGLRPDEGGIDLAMSAAMISLLGARGECAGDLLKRCFARGSDPGADYWDAHRWTRFRASAAAIEGLLLRVHKGYEAQAAVPSQQGLPSPLTYAMLIERAEGAPPALYGWPRGRRQAAIARSAELTALAASWSPGPELSEGAPTPPSELWLSPHI